MALRKPTGDDLRRLAEAHNFELSEEEVEAFQSMLPGMFTSLDELDQKPSNLPAIAYRDRDPGIRPSPRVRSSAAIASLSVGVVDESRKGMQISSDVWAFVYCTIAALAV